jgi:hypothetical protein
MKTSRIVYVVGLFTICLALATAQSVERPNENDDSVPLELDVSAYEEGWLIGDTNEDGTLDYALMLDDANDKRYEAMDFNFDGSMDDFYYYERGVLVREEIDTNFDGLIDLWIYMHEGVYVRSYERDTDFDGTIDLVKEFGE